MGKQFFEYKGKKLHYAYWAKEQNNTIIILFHGHGEHLGRYEHWANRFGEFNYGVCCMDFFGHGLSSGQRGHMPSLEWMLGSMDAFVEKVKESFPSKKYVLYGHSMGGNLLAQYMIQYQPKVSGAIFSSPWIGLTTPPPKTRIWLANMMYKIFRSFPDNTRLDPKNISTQPEEVARYAADPLIHSRITPGLFVPIYGAEQWLLENANRIQIPALVFHSLQDGLTSSAVSAKFAEAMPMGKMMKFTLSKHEIHWDVERDTLFNALLDWLAGSVKYRT